MNARVGSAGPQLGDIDEPRVQRLGRGNVSTTRTNMSVGVVDDLLFGVGGIRKFVFDDDAQATQPE